MKFIIFLILKKKERNGHFTNGKMIEHPKSFAAYHAAGTIISMHSFSKILTPGLRLGFVCASHEHINAMNNFGLIQSGGGANPLISSIIDRLVVNGGLNKFIDETLCTEYRKRMNNMYNILMKTFGDKYIICRRPSGGYYLWIKFKDTTIDCDKLLVYAHKYGVDFRPGRLFGHDEDAKAYLANNMRLCFASVDSEQLIEGCERLKRAFEEYKSVTL